MSKPHGYIFVLWGDKFAEVTTTIFTCELREAGLKVRVVGLTPQPIQGRHGLALVPDIMLDQALLLATQVYCLIIPYASSSIQRLINDPRLCELFDQAQANQAKFVINKLNKTEFSNLIWLPEFGDEQILIYPTQAELAQFVRELAGILQMNYY